jgi:putative ABC transport system permease protein
MATLTDVKANPIWIWTIFGTYGLVREGTDIAALTKKMQALPPKWAAATTERVFNQKFDDFVAGKKWTLYLQPLRDIYLASAPTWHHFGPSGNPQFVLIFGVIGALVLTLSCINFMNLSTARSGNRAKEVGIRKVLGSEKSILVRQFIAESTLYVFVATVVALVIVQLSLNGFNVLADKQLTLLPHFTNPMFVGVLAVFILALGVIAGSYPAFYLSAFQPAQTLKGKIRSGFRRSSVRNALVVFQFTVSIALIICTFFVQKQLAYAGAVNVGIVKDNVLQLHYMEQLGTNVEVLKNQLAANPAVKSIALSHTVPPNVWEGDRYKPEGPDKPVVDLTYFRIDEQYLPMIGAEFLLGRNFDPSNGDDKHKIILNEEAVRSLGWGMRDQWVNDSPLGKHVLQAFGKEEKLEVIGVVKNFNFNSVKQRIAPLLIMHRDNDLHWSYHTGPLYLSLRLNPASVKNGDDMQALLDKVQAQVKAIDPTVVFQYSFMDEEFDNTFRTERRMGVVLNWFTGLAVVIACLGLFGLAAFSAEQRLKELGIRKVMGAKVHELVLLFSSEFTRLVAVAIALATPLAWWLTDKWLSNFAFRTPIDVWVFIVAAFSALAIAGITISYQAIAAARTNPVDTLRNE